MLILTLLAFLPLASANLVPLSLFGSSETLYRVSTASRVFVISNSSQDVMQSLSLSTGIGGQNSDGYTLSIPQSDGSLIPLHSTSDNDLLSVTYSGSTPLTGWLYISNVSSTVNVFPLKDDSVISYKSGINVFFRMGMNTEKIPVAENVVVSSNVDLSGFVGLPDDANPVQFFGTAQIPWVNFYKQLELPMQMFYFTSSGSSINYEVKYSDRSGMAIGSAGLVMTNDFPSGAFSTEEFSFTNTENAEIEMYFVPRLDKTKAYGGNVTYFDTSDVPTVVPIVSIADSNFTATAVLSRVVIEADGPFAVQYTFKDLSITTPAPVITTTMSSSIPQLLVSLLVAAFLKF